MRTFPATLLAFGLATSLGSAQAAGTVTLSWLESVNYTDAGHNVVDRERTLQELGRHIVALGARLQEGQVLRLEVLDLDLAGEVRPLRGLGWQEVRVMGDHADSPQMRVRYTLQDGTHTLASGESRLIDMGYLFRHREGALAYEKRMVDDWFARSIAPQAVAR